MTTNKLLGHEAAKAEVTDKMLIVAIEAFNRDAPMFKIFSPDSTHSMRNALEAVAPMLTNGISEELMEWEEFGQQIEKRLRYNPWNFKGSYPEIIDQIVRLASVHQLGSTHLNEDPIALARVFCEAIIEHQYQDPSRKGHLCVEVEPLLKVINAQRDAGSTEASARALESLSFQEGDSPVIVHYKEGWNACRKAMFDADTKSDTEK